MEFTEMISVVMPTYNTAVPILKEAVDSILAQTFGAFEFIIIDDCSTNESRAYLQDLSDPRITQQLTKRFIFEKHTHLFAM